MEDESAYVSTGWARAPALQFQLTTTSVPAPRDWMRNMEIIRHGTAEHFEDLVAVDQIAQQDPERREELRRWLEAGSVRVATRDGSPVGYTVAEPSFFGNDFLALIVVGEQHRKAGIGQLLMSDVETTKRDTKLFTSTNLSNQVMQRLLARRGWVSSGMVFGLDEGDPELFYRFP